MAEKDKRCQVKMHDIPCGRELYDERKCIFHSKKHDKNAKLFQEQLDEIFKDKSLKSYDFSNFIFPEGILFPKEIDKEILFLGAVLQGEACFLEATFYCSASFSGATFGGKADFEAATFKNDADFSTAVFRKDAWFLSTTFQKECRFFWVSFKGMVIFTYATFEGLLEIDEEGNNKIFSEKEVDFRCVRFLEPEKVGFKKVDLSEFRFLGTDLRKVKFADVNWYWEKGRYTVYDEILLHLCTYDETEDYFIPGEFDYPLIGQVYRTLRANYEENLNYAEAGDFHIGEMEMRRKGEKNIFNKGIIWAYKLVSNYGENYWLPLGWIALLLLVFPLLYMLVGIVLPTQINGSQSLEKLKDYWSSFTYSLSVFSLVRERPYHTINNLGHILTILESIFSPVMIAFFLLALRRRFKR